MPIPTQKDEESRENFISRCVSNDKTKKEFPDQSQRVAVCMSRAMDGLNISQAADLKYNVETFGFTEDVTEGNFHVPAEDEYEDWGEDTEEIEVSKAIDFTKSDSSGACWEGYERVPNTKKGDPGSCRKIGSSQVSGSKADRAGPMQDYIFTTKEAAMKMAEKLGMSGVHTSITADGLTLYIPGKTEEEFSKKKRKNDGVDASQASEYQGRKVTLNKPFRTPDGPKKRSVYVKNDKGNVVKVNFGDPNMEIKKDNPERRKSFRARHKCDTAPGPKWKARYWSCKMW